jgi:hypothetical protein
MTIKTKQYIHKHYKYIDRFGEGMAWNNKKQLLWNVWIDGKKYPTERNHGYRAKSEQEAIYMALKESGNLLGDLYFSSS